MSTKENEEFLNIDGSLYKTRISTKFKNRKPYTPSDPGIIMSFIPGTVISILVKQDQIVKKGDDLIILDAMKMKNRLKSSVDGRVRSIAVKEGDIVTKGALLMELE